VVSEAGTLADAVREWSAGRPAWILLDLMLPDGNGTDLLRRLRREHHAAAAAAAAAAGDASDAVGHVNGNAIGGHTGSARSKVCVITGCGAAAVHEARALGPDHVFTKPLNVEGLLAVMTSASDADMSASVAV
jgi:DNA-binding response OmpR family regulator